MSNCRFECKDLREFDHVAKMMMKLKVECSTGRDLLRRCSATSHRACWHMYISCPPFAINVGLIPVSFILILAYFLPSDTFVKSPICL